MMEVTIDHINELRVSILDIRRRNYDLRSFVPQDTLHRLLTLPVVLSTLKSSGLNASRLNELAQSVHQGARNVFAILVILRQIQRTPDFVVQDQFQDIDHQLPFDLDELERTIPQRSIAKEFYDQQWQFLVPVFSKKLLPRELMARTPLPITERVEIGSGSFGTAYKIKIHPSHHKFGASVEGYFVQKSFSAAKGIRKDYESEAYNLSILSHLRHPHIIELLSAFTHHDQHHLIFPWVPDGDLAALLQGSASEFRSYEEWTVALCHLASAIERVHNFTAESMLDLQLIGCHHDLKPRNILVKGTTLMLADFGLSRFRDLSESSATRHRIGQGDYLAPECEELENSFAKGIIGRSSDIWSFGCIIAEILSYMLKGADGVKEFKERRRYRLHNYLFSYFHRGPGAPNPGTADWLSRLEGESQAIVPMLLPLIRQMLSMEPAQRPKAAEVQARLQSIAVRLIAEEIASQYEAACEQNLPTSAWIERWRFESWSHACGTTRAVEAPGAAPVEEFDHEFQATLDVLYHIREQLKTIMSTYQKVQERAFFPLRYFNNCLTELLPPTAQREMQDELERRVLNIQETERMRDVGQTLRAQNLGEKTVKLVAIKRMTVLVDQHLSMTQPRLQIHPERVRRPQKPVKLQSGEIMVIDGTEGGVPVLIEWVQHESHVMEENGCKRLLNIDALVALLSLEDKPKDFRVLHCSAYFHEKEKERYGMVFELPAASVDGEPLEPVPLAAIFVTHGTGRPRPALGDKFKLAHALAASIAEFHKVGWLHKNISSSNIIFFSPQGSSPEKHILRPYVIGFSHSRPVFGRTDGPYDIKFKDYQHPEYLKNELRFNFKFDYYSLGLVLLEIGYWESLHNMAHRWHGSPEEFRDRLLERRVPRLKEKMGDTYLKVVEVCLRSAFMANGKSEDGVDGTTALHLEFEKLVVAELAKCSA